jgi:hypothetical protein
VAVARTEPWAPAVEPTGHGPGALVPSRGRSLFAGAGPVARAVVLHDFVVEGKAPNPELWAAECRVLGEQRLAATARRFAHDRNIDIPAKVDSFLLDAEFAWAAITIDSVESSAPALGALRAKGIEFAITKGPGIARFHHRFQERPYSDLDVIVRPRDFRAAHHVLRRIGFAEEPKNRQPWPVFNRHCREAINLRTGGGGSLDLHHRIPPWYWGTLLDADRLLAEAATETVLGVPLPCVSPRHNLLISALHIFSDRNRPGQSLLVWRDLLTMVSVCPPEDIVAEALEVGLAGWLRWILGSLPLDSRAGALLHVLDGAGGAVRGRRRLAMLMPPALGSRHLVGQALRLPVPNGALYLAGTVVPSPRFLRERFPTERHRYRRWWHETSHRFDQAWNDHEGTS